MSVRAFERKFRASFHLTPQKYLRKLQMRMANGPWFTQRNHWRKWLFRADLPIRATSPVNFAATSAARPGITALITARNRAMPLLAQNLPLVHNKRRGWPGYIPGLEPLTTVVTNGTRSHVKTTCLDVSDRDRPGRLARWAPQTGPYLRALFRFSTAKI